MTLDILTKNIATLFFFAVVILTLLVLLKDAWREFKYECREARKRRQLKTLKDDLARAAIAFRIEMGNRRLKALKEARLQVQLRLRPIPGRSKEIIWYPRKRENETSDLVDPFHC